MDKVRDFKNAVKLYYYHKQQLYYLEGRLSYIAHQLIKIKSPTLQEPKGIPVYTTMDLFDEEAQLIKEKHKHQFNVEWVDRVLPELNDEVRLVLQKVYLKKTHTYERMAFKLYCNERKLKQKVDNELLEIL